MPNRPEDLNGNCVVETEDIDIRGFGVYPIERLKQVTPGDCAVAAYINTRAMLSMLDPEIVRDIPENDMGKVFPTGIAGVREILVDQLNARPEVKNMEEPLRGEETVNLFRTLYPNAKVRQKDVIKSQPELDDVDRMSKSFDVLDLLDEEEFYGEVPRVMVLGINGHCTTLVRVPGDNYIHIDPMNDSYEYLNTETAMPLLQKIDEDSRNFIFLLQKPNSQGETVNSIAD